MARRQSVGIVAAGVVLSLVLLASCGSPASTTRITTPSHAPTQTSSSPSPTALPNPVFAFQKDPDQPASQWFFVDSHGTVLHSFVSTGLDSTFVPLTDTFNYIGRSTAILARSNGITLNTKWSVIEADGTASLVPASLTPLLNEIGFPGEFLVAPSLFFGVAQFPNPQNPFKFYELNLATGAILASASLVPLNPSGTVLFEPENIDAGAHLLSFLIGNTTFDSVKISGLSVGTLDFETSAITVHPLPPQVVKDILPVQGGGTPQYEATAYVSGDGSTLIYQSSTYLQSGSPTTYILSLRTGQTLTLAPDLDLTFIEGQNSVFFSPTGTYAALIGSAPTADSGACFIIDVATGTRVSDLCSTLPDNASVTFMDWAAPTQLIYATNQTNQIDTSVTHIYDLQSGDVTTFRSDLGFFIAVLP